MNDIDMKLREKIKMLDEIDKMVKNEPMRSGNSSRSKINYNQSYNNSIYNKSSDKFSNTNLSNDLDYPLQCNNSKKKFPTTSGNNIQPNLLNQKHGQEQTKENMIYSNFNNYTNLTNNFEKPERTKSNDNVNYYTIYGNDIYSTKEFTEPYTGKSKKNVKFNEGENTYGTSIPSGRSLNSSNQIRKVQNSQRNRTPTKRDKSPRQLVNININFNNDGEKSPNRVGERLYNYGFYVKDKIEKKRMQEENNLLRQMTPEISNKARKIQRDPKKFHERLYPAHKVGQISSNQEEYPNEEINNPLIMENDTKNTIHTTPNFDENPNSNSFTGEYKNDKASKIYRKTPSTNSLLPFDHKPKLDKNSMKIAANLTPSKIRLVAKKPKPIKNDLSNLSYLSEDNHSKSPCRTPRSRSKTPTNRHNELYSKGLEHYKKREILHNHKKLIEEEEFKNYSYKPKIISHSPVITGRKVPKSSSKSGKSSDTIEESSRSNVYDKHLHWKKNVNSRTEKLKQNIDNDRQGIYTFKPTISKNIKPNDDKFIIKNLNQIEEYVNRRRSAIQKQKEEEEYKKKRFFTGEGYKCKMTVPKQFNFKTDERSRSRSKDGNKSKDSYLESRSNASPHNVHAMREQLRTNEFFQNNFDNPDSPINNYNTYQEGNNCSQNYSPHNLKSHNQASKPKSNSQSGDNSMHVFMNAINNLHEQLVNFKI